MAVTLGGLNNRTGGLIAKQTLPFAGQNFFTWYGIAVVPSGSAAASLSIKVPSQEKGFDDLSTLVIPANSEIISVGFKVTGNVTLGAATGKLKLAPALDASAADLYVESAAAAGGVLSAATALNNNPLDATTTVGGADVTYSIYATDGAAGASAAASTVTATSDTRILVAISGYYPADFPGDNEFPELIEQSIYQDVTVIP